MIFGVLFVCIKTTQRQMESINNCIENNDSGFTASFRRHLWEKRKSVDLCSPSGWGNWDRQVSKCWQVSVACTLESRLWQVMTVGEESCLDENWISVRWSQGVAYQRWEVHRRKVWRVTGKYLRIHKEAWYFT